MRDDIEREWTQDELRRKLIADGMRPEELLGVVIPQGVKFTKRATLSAIDIARARQLIAAHPEWGK